MMLFRILIFSIIAAGLKAQSNTSDSFGRKQGFWKITEGEKKLVEANYEDDTLHGVYKEFKEKRLVLVANYSKGQLHGVYNSFRESGLPLIKGNFLYGLPNGLFEWYDTKGRLLKKIEFNNGAFDGEWKSYLKGRLVASAQFNNNILHGNFIVYTKEGGIALKSIFRDGKMLSGEMVYDKQGRLLYIKLPNDTRDRLIGVMYFDKHGTRKSKIKSINELSITYGYFGSEVHKSGRL